MSAWWLVLASLAALWLAGRRVARKERQRWISKGQAIQIIEYTNEKVDRWPK